MAKKLTRLHRAVRVEGMSSTAAKLGVTKQQLWNWIARGAVPERQCVRVRDALQHHGIALRDLRADWREIWPDQVRT